MKNNDNKNRMLSGIIVFFIVFLPYFFNKLLNIIIKECRNNAYFSIILIEIYLIFTLLLYYFGPIKYPILYFGKTLFLLISYNLAFIIGFIFSIKLVKINPIFKTSSIRVHEKLIIIGAFISIFISIQYLIYFSNSSNIIVIFKQVLGGILNPSIGYNKNIDLIKEGSIFTKLETLLSPMVHIAIAYGAYYFKRLKYPVKIQYFILILLNLSTYLIKGTNFGIVYVLLTIIVIFIFNRKSKPLNFIIIIFFVFTLTYFLFSISSRMKLSIIPNTVFTIPVDKNNILFKIFENSISIPLLIGSTYLSQGYYGFSLVHQFEFLPTFGAGSGRFLIDKFSALLNMNIWERTYQSRMSEIWNSRVNWHTIYLWFSNDVGIYGVILIMLILGILFGLVLKSTLEKSNPFSLSLLSLYFLMILFFPANNIVFDNPIMFMPFVCLNLWFLLSNKLKVKI